MSILEINNLSFGYDDKNLFNGANLKVEPLEHIGIVGPNGSGKSTLMKLISHKMPPDMGDIKWLNGVSFSYLDQHLHVESDDTISSYLYKVYEHLFQKENEMNELYDSLINIDESKYDKVLTKAENIQEYLGKNDFYKIKSLISSVVNGLGLNFDLNFKMKNLSSGQRGKVFLAKMLLEQKDVLLLDEPTNFLDTQHVEWLSKFLVSYPKAFIVISHDSSFLNDVCNYVVELSNKTLTKFKGNFDSFVLQKTQKDEQYLKEYEKQQKYIKKTTEFIDKNLVRASTTKQAQSRRRELAKVKVLEKPKQEKKVYFEFPFTQGFNMEALRTNNLEIGYEYSLLPKINLKVKFGDKIIIIGKNGVGKTTFLKTILNEINCISGSFFLNPLNKIVYYKQESYEKMTISAIDYIREKYPLMDDTEIRTLLGKYGIRGELATKELSSLSGGEITKVRFSRLSLEKSNLLILDEPTNHLDKIAKQSLFKAIEEYKGTVILVSHETEFYKKLNMKEVYFG